MALILQQVLKNLLEFKILMKSYKNRVQELIQKFEKVHGNLYTYDNLNYQGARNNVTITCSIHGDFEQRCDRHIAGSGCPSCFRNKQGWGKTEFVNACLKHDNKGTLYIIRCYNEKEEFFKIGITGQTIFQRFGFEDKPTIRMPYKFEIIHLFQDSSSLIWDLEKMLHRLYKSYSYVPEIKFPGHKECFKVVSLWK